MTADMNSALAAADAAGLHLRADGGRVVLRPGWADLPAHHRATLRQHKPELLALLAAHPRPDPAEVWFVRRNLTVVRLDRVPGDQRHFWLGGRVHHRLTPAVLVYLATAINRRLLGLADADRAELVNAYAPLLGYVDRHFRPDQVERSEAAPPLHLHEPACPAP